MTQSEKQLRRDLVTCTRLLAFVGVLDYSGHVSARIPGTDEVLIQPRDTSRAALTPEELLVIDLDDQVVRGDGLPVAEAAIHTGVYRARDDVTVICHGHPSLSTTFTMTSQPMLPMRHFAYKFADGLAVHPDPRHIRTREQGDAVAATLAQAGACMLRSHGTVVVGDRFDVLFMDCLDIEENARTQLAAVQLGGELRPLTPDEVEQIAASYGGLGHRPSKMWEHYIHRAHSAGAL